MYVDMYGHDLNSEYSEEYLFWQVPAEVKNMAVSVS